LQILLSDPELDAVIFLGAAFGEKWSSDLPKLLNELAAAHQDKPLVCCIWGPYGNETINKLHEMGKTVGFPTPERAVRALARLNEYSRLRGRL
jgi:acyl-CoA synthetase (NDP forming)